MDTQFELSNIGERIHKVNELFLGLMGITKLTRPMLNKLTLKNIDKVKEVYVELDEEIYKRFCNNIHLFYQFPNINNLKALEDDLNRLKLNAYEEERPQF